VRGHDEVESLSLRYTEFFKLRALCDYPETRLQKHILIYISVPLCRDVSSNGERLFTFVDQESLFGSEDIRRK